MPAIPPVVIPGPVPVNPTGPVQQRLAVLASQTHQFEGSGGTGPLSVFLAEIIALLQTIVNPAA